MSIRYIGSKARMTDIIVSRIGLPDGNRFIDAFCGMGSVAVKAAEAGWPIMVNDALLSATLVARARLVSTSDISFEKIGGYQAAIFALNNLEPELGYIWRTYSPASSRNGSPERRYFTEGNAAKIDSIRKKIAEWYEDSDITKIERDLLLADLMQATNAVANTAGTYGCFLSKWQPGAFKNIEMLERALLLSPVDVQWSTGDAADVRAVSSDTAYLDPPYTKRQYASYYHILETIAHGDDPEVEGVAGLRPWRHAASEFCYKRRAVAALQRTVEMLACRRVFISYSDEGHMVLDDMVNALSSYGAVCVHSVDEVGRYRPNRVASAARSTTQEVLIEMTREVAA